MATIRAVCDQCHKDVELAAGDVHVRVCVDTNRGAYRFTCTRCRAIVVKGAEPRTVELLVASGVDLTKWALPLELAERHEGDPIGPDDCLDFHQVRSFATGWGGHFPTTDGTVEREASIGTAHIPEWCVPGHDETDDYEIDVVLDEAAVRALVADLTEWLNRPKVHPR